MTLDDYARLGYSFPVCEVSQVWNGSDPRLVTVRLPDGREDSFTLDFGGPELTAADCLFMLFTRAQEATMYLRDFIRDWSDQTWSGRVQAISEWRRLRHQRRRMKALFGDKCP